MIYDGHQQSQFFSSELITSSILLRQQTLSSESYKQVTAEMHTRYEILYGPGRVHKLDWVTTSPSTGFHHAAQPMISQLYECTLLSDGGLPHAAAAPCSGPQAHLHVCAAAAHVGGVCRHMKACANMLPAPLVNTYHRAPHSSCCTRHRPGIHSPNTADFNLKTINVGSLEALEAWAFTMATWHS